MDENEFWVRVWKIVGAVVVTVILTAGGCTSYRATLIAESPDPIATACAVSDSTIDAACLVAMRR